MRRLRIQERESFYFSTSNLTNGIICDLWKVLAKQYEIHLDRGCQMNVMDSQVGSLEHLGCTLTETIEADVIVLNTCVVRQSAEDVLGRVTSRAEKEKPNLVISKWAAWSVRGAEKLREKLYVDILAL
jgi:hypothetical protein